MRRSFPLFRTKILMTTLTFAVMFPGEVRAFCSPPDAPDSPPTYQRPSKPITPYCVDTFRGTHACDDWEIDSYNDAVRQYKYELEEYIRRLNNFVMEAESFANEAVDYANCEIRNLD